jgi:hypothetical protein
MLKHFVLRNGVVAALIIGSLAGSLSSSSAMNASGGPNGNSGNAGGRGSSAGNGGMGSGQAGGGGSTSDAARLVTCAASVACQPPARPKPRRPTMHIGAKVIEQQRCSNQWRNVMLEDGSIVEDRSQPMLRNCRVIRRFD